MIAKQPLSRISLLQRWLSRLSWWGARNTKKTPFSYFLNFWWIWKSSTSPNQWRFVSTTVSPFLEKGPKSSHWIKWFDVKMLEKLLKNYEHLDRKKLFKENEKIYDSYLNTIFNGFRQKDIENNYFSHIFSEIFSISSKNSQQYSGLKQMCHELADFLFEAGKILHKINEAYGRTVKSPQEFSRNINSRWTHRPIRSTSYRKMDYPNGHCNSSPNEN